MNKKIHPPAAQLEPEAEVEQEADKKEESDEDEDEEESGRQRFRSERKGVTVVRISDAGSKRRNIPETLGESDVVGFCFTWKIINSYETS